MYLRQEQPPIPFLKNWVYCSNNEKSRPEVPGRLPEIQMLRKYNFAKFEDDDGIDRQQQESTQAQAKPFLALQPDTPELIDQIRSHLLLLRYELNIRKGCHHV